MELAADQTHGLVCAHHHLYSSLARGMPAPTSTPTSFVEILNSVWWKLDQALDLETIAWSAKLGALEALRSGTTCIIDHHESPNAIEGSLSTIAEACATVGVRVNTCYGVTDRNPGLSEKSHQMTAEAKRGLEENRRFIEGGGRGMVGVHAAFTCSDETLEAAASLASELNVGVHVHVAEGEVDCLPAKRLLLLSLLFIGCNNQSKEYTDITTSERDIQYYELKERIIEDDNGTLIGIKAPDYLKAYQSNSPQRIQSFELFNDNTKMMVSIDKLESRNTINVSNKDYVDATHNAFVNEWGSDLKRIEELLPKQIYNNVQAVSFRSDLKINNKYFLERVLYYNDSRLSGTEYEGIMSVEYNYKTIHNGRQYSINIIFYGDYTIAEFIGLSRSIAGTVKFLN